MKKLFAAALLFFVGTFAIAQTSNVTATVTDSDGQTWNNGTYQIVFIPPSGYNGSTYTFNGAPFTPPSPITGSLTGGGGFTYNSLKRNDYILPSGSSWLFNFCPNASWRCSATNIVVNLASQNISSSLVLVAPRFTASNFQIGSFGYADVEVSPTPPIGNGYFNVNSNNSRIWTGSTWINGAGAPSGVGTIIPGSNITCSPNPCTGATVTINSTAGGSTTFQVDGTPLSSQSTVNFEAGSNVTITNPSGGNILISASGGGGMVYPSAGLAASTGTAWRTPTFSDVVALWASGSCSGYLKSDGTCGAGGSGNPVQVNGTAVGGSATNFNNAVPSHPGGDVGVVFQTDGNGNASAYVPSSAVGLSLFANTNYIVAGDSRNLISSSCITSTVDRGSITSGNVSGGIATFQTTNGYGFASGPSGFVGSILQLGSFGGSYTALNGQLFQFTSANGTTLVGPVTGVPDGPTGTGIQHCAYNMAGLLTNSPYMPVSSAVVNLAIPNQSVSELITNFTSEFSPYYPATTSKPAIVILQAGVAEALGCTPASTIESEYTTLWGLFAANNMKVMQTSLITDNGSIYCSTAQVASIVLTVNLWLKAQTPAGVVQSGSGDVIPGWTYWFDAAQVLPNATNAQYFVNPSGQTHLTDQGNFHYYYGILDALLFGGDIPGPELCDSNSNQACLGYSVNFYNESIQNQLMVQNLTYPAQQITWEINQYGTPVLLSNVADSSGGITTVYPIAWWNGPLYTFPYLTGGVCGGINATQEPVPAICLTEDQSTAHQFDVGSTVGDTSYGIGLKWLYPNLATAPALSSSCTGVPVGYYPARDKTLSYCDGSVWSQPFTILSSCGIYNIPCTNTSNTFSGGTQTFITVNPTIPAIIEQGSSGLLTPVIVQATNSSGSFPSNVTTGNAVIAFCNVNPQSFTDNLGNVYSNIASLYNSFFQYPVVFLATNVNGGALNLAPCYGSSNQQVAYEISNLASSPVDAIDLNFSYLASTNTRTVTTTQAGDFLVAGILTNGNGTTNAPATPSFGNLTCNTQGGPPGGDCGSALSAKMAPTVATYSSTWSGLSSADFGFLVALKPVTSLGQTADLHQYKAPVSLGGAILGGVDKIGLPYMVPVLYSALPSSPQAGQLAIISDASGTPAWGATAAGSGTPANSTTFEVMYNGTNWIYQ